jgi:hypothetical protein
MAGVPSIPHRRQAVYKEVSECLFEALVNRSAPFVELLLEKGLLLCKVRLRHISFVLMRVVHEKCHSGGREAEAQPQVQLCRRH